MARKYKEHIEASKGRLDNEIRNVARKIAHHGPEDLVETIRQRCNVALNKDYARKLCLEFGWHGKG
jgi:hypothetical protein